MSVGAAAARAAFRSAFGGEAAVLVRAPGRVNLIGEHTDYNHGFVLPMAIDRDTAIAARPRADAVLRVHAAHFGATAEIDLRAPARDPAHPWIDYVAGVAAELQAAGHATPGADAVVLGDVPLGCGLSSSAALEMAALCMFEALGGYALEGPAAAQLGQRVENRFLGLESGIMDQFASRCARAGHALYLDCRTLAHEAIPIAVPGVCFVIANTACPRGLTASKYNVRVAECRAAAEALRAASGRAGSHLRDYTLADLEAAAHAMPDAVYRRARHVMTENDRTASACAALRQADGRGAATVLGLLMDASDTSLREDYEVTCPELDAMTAIARTLPGCYGARMTGAGFGGCTVNLVARDAAEAFAEALTHRYREATGRPGEALITTAAAGAGRLEPGGGD